MSRRRLLALALVAIWLLPIAAAGGVALHVALDHDHRHEHGGGVPVGTEPAAFLPQLLLHGHAHDEDDRAHEHAVTPVVDAGFRTQRFVEAPLPVWAATFAADTNARSRVVFEAPPTPPPPRHADSAQLASLSTLRI